MPFLTPTPESAWLERWSECERTTPMCGRGSQPDHVEQRATANSDHAATVAVDAMHLDFD